MEGEEGPDRFPDRADGPRPGWRDHGRACNPGHLWAPAAGPAPCDAREVEVDALLVRPPWRRMGLARDVGQPVPLPGAALRHRATDRPRPGPLRPAPRRAPRYPQWTRSRADSRGALRPRRDRRRGVPPHGWPPSAGRHRAGPGPRRVGTRRPEGTGGGGVRPTAGGGQAPPPAAVHTYWRLPAATGNYRQLTPSPTACSSARSPPPGP